MSYAADLIEAAVVAGKFESESALATRGLKVTAQTLNQWKQGQINIPDKRVMAIAKLAGVEPAKAVVEYRYDTATDPEVRRHMHWLVQVVRKAAPGTVKRLRDGRISAPLALFFALTLAGAGASPSDASTVHYGPNSPALYIMSYARRRLRLRRRRLPGRRFGRVRSSGISPLRRAA